MHAWIKITWLIQFFFPSPKIIYVNHVMSTKYEDVIYIVLGIQLGLEVLALKTETRHPH
jgi:hypothetical protein